LFFEDVYRCPFEEKYKCSHTAETLQQIWNHARGHGVENFPWACRTCKAVFFYPSKLIDHYQKKHGNCDDAKKIVHRKCGCHHSYLPIYKN